MEPMSSESEDIDFEVRLLISNLICQLFAPHVKND
jgi:hypothetical protein